MNNGRASGSVSICVHCPLSHCPFNVLNIVLCLHSCNRIINVTSTRTSVPCHRAWPIAQHRPWAHASASLTPNTNRQQINRHTNHRITSGLSVPLPDGGSMITVQLYTQHSVQHVPVSSAAALAPNPRAKVSECLPLPVRARTQA